MWEGNSRAHSRFFVESDEKKASASAPVLETVENRKPVLRTSLLHPTLSRSHTVQSNTADHDEARLSRRMWAWTLLLVAVLCLIHAAD